jgi:hypothetical protein
VKILLIGLWLCLISGCSSMYVPKDSDEPHGYSDITLDGGGYLVSYETYKSVSYDEMFEFVVKRSAELAHLEGYDEFNISNRKDEMNIELIEMPLVTTTSTQSNLLAGGVTVMSSHVDVVSPGYTREVKIKKTTAKLVFSREDTIGMRFFTADALAN